MTQCIEKNKIAGTIPFEVEDLFWTVRDTILEQYGADNLTSILAYGSRIHYPDLVDVYSDYDVTIVFNKYQDVPLPFLNDKVDLTFTFLPEILDIGVESFKFDTHGSFYIYTLSEAISLYGRNPFQQLKELVTLESVNESLREQILLHACKLQRFAMDCDSISRYRNIVKYSLRICQNRYFLNNPICYELFFNKNKDFLYQIMAKSLAQSESRFLKMILFGNILPERSEILRFAKDSKKHATRI